MRKEAILIILLISIVFFLPLIIADEQSQVDEAYACLNSKINSTGCSSLTFEQRVFSLLATGKCLNEVYSDNLQNNCWPASSCDIKSTALAILALRDSKNVASAEDWLLSQKATPTGMDWFLEIESSESVTCSITLSDLTYNVEIGEDKKIVPSGSLGNCFSLAQDDYWLKISPQCYSENIKISCDSGFLTTLLFKKTDSPTIQVSDEPHSASARGLTTEKVENSCFAKNGNCDYEGSLWAAAVLHSSGEDVSEFMPYLITMREENEEYLPESLLYFLTGEYKTELLLKQKAGLYWSESGNRYYDTAMALLSLYYDNSFEKINSIEWLLDVQGDDGCWNSGNIRDTAFLLYSIWPEETPSYSECFSDSDCPEVSCKDSFCSDGLCFYTWFACEDNDNCCPPGCKASTDNDCASEIQCESDADCQIYVDESNKYCIGDSVYKDVSDWTCEDNVCVEEITEELIETCGQGEQCFAGNCLSGESTDTDCEANGYFCMSKASCSGNVLDNYECDLGVYICCDTEEQLSKCSEEGGKICDSDEYCSGGTIVDASDTASGEICCVSGTCKVYEDDQGLDCGDYDGICRTSCSNDEEENDFYECSYGKVCCMELDEQKTSYWWIWILIILIILSAIGIVFRDKLRTSWMKFKSKFGKKKGKNKIEMPSHSALTPLKPRPRILPRRIFPPGTSKKYLPRKIPPHKKEPEKPSELDEVLKKLKDMGK